MATETSNVVVIVRIAGNVLACVRDGELLRIRAVGTCTGKPADQSAAMALLREEDDHHAAACGTGT